MMPRCVRSIATAILFVALVALHAAGVARAGAATAPAPAAMVDGRLSAVPIPANKTRVTSLPGMGPFPAAWNHYGGFVTVNKGTSYLYYYLAQYQGGGGGADTATTTAATNDKPLVVWLQGGPGCSGMLALFTESGPFFLRDDGATLDANPHPWSAAANVLYVDQPVMTGYSYFAEGGEATGWVNDEATMAATMVEFLEGFYALFPWLRANGLFLAGESFAGKYIPHLATAILAANDAATDAAAALPLRGALIGDGWTAPLAQTSVVAEQAFMLGLIDGNQMANATAQFKQCEALVAAEKWAEAQVLCDAISDYVVGCAGGINVNDVRTFDTSLPPWLAGYLNRADVRAALGVPAAADGGPTYATCPDPPFNHLAACEMKPAQQLLPGLFARMPVLLYSGQFDLNCGVAGTEKYLAALEWPGAGAYAAAPRSVWRTAPGSTVGAGNTTVAGYVRGPVMNLTQLVVLGAGHLVPKNQPQNALAMLATFIAGKPFAGTAA